VVTHDAEEAMRMSDRIALLKRGRLVQMGPAQSLFQKPADLFVAGFFSELNLFESRARAGRVETPLGQFEAPGIGEGVPVTVAVRLAGIEVCEKDGGTAARVISRRFLGEAEALELAVAGAETPVRARIRCGVLPAGARDIWLTVRKSDVLVFESRAENA
jgi:iron(III) transport system ATP-binding protein